MCWRAQSIISLLHWKSSPILTSSDRRRTEFRQPNEETTLSVRMERDTPDATVFCANSRDTRRLKLIRNEYGQRVEDLGERSCLTDGERVAAQPQ
jgi:hypothetical protein